MLRDHGIDAATTRHYQMHHVVAENEGRAEEARDILGYAGIGIHDLVNLLPLRTEVHQRLHTTAYYRKVNSDLKAAYDGGGRSAVEAMLNTIKTRLLATGTYP